MPRIRSRIRVAFLALCIIPAVAFAGLVQNPEFPVVGKEVTLFVSQKIPESGSTMNAVPHAWVNVTYRPNSIIPANMPAGQTRSDGTLNWIPELPGICRIAYEKNGQTEETTISVRYDGPPLSGIFIMIVAGIILYGGIGYFMVHMFSSPKNPHST